MCPGYADSRGNDCAPVDMRGIPTIHPLMPQATLIAQLSDGRVLCNDRGLYYVGLSKKGDPLSELMQVRTSGRSSCARRGRAWPQLLTRMIFKRLKHLIRQIMFVFSRRRRSLADDGVMTKRKPDINVARDALKARPLGYQAPKKSAEKISYGLRRILITVAALRVIIPSKVRRRMYHVYKRLPEPLRYSLNKFVLVRLRNNRKHYWQQISEQDSQSNIIRARMLYGVARILQNFAASHGMTLTQLTIFDGPNATGRLASELRQITGSSLLPAAAAEIFSDLVNGLGRHSTPEAVPPSNTD
jgi:hypothetical protein